MMSCASGAPATICAEMPGQCVALAFAERCLRLDDLLAAEPAGIDDVRGLAPHDFLDQRPQAQVVVIDRILASR
jgi:hypothetical protein